MTDRPPNQFDGELAALRHQREMDSLTESPAVEGVVDAAVQIATSGLSSCVGLFRRALKLGKPTVEQLVDQLESASFEEIRRIWDHLDGNERRQQEFEYRLQSQEAQSAYLSAFFHGLRTSDPQKHSRLGRVTINSAFLGEFDPESLDTIMRATVELTTDDLRLLGEMYVMQRDLFSDAWISRHINERSNYLQRLWQVYWNENQERYLGLDGVQIMASFTRLQSLGFIGPGPDRSSASSPVSSCYWLLPEGKKFHERIQYIPVAD
jgi:hypothetical protein